MRAPYRLLLLLAVALNALPATANQPLFDAHLHYDIDSASDYTPGEIVAILQANGVKRAVATVPAFASAFPV